MAIQFTHCCDKKLKYKYINKEGIYIEFHIIYCVFLYMLVIQNLTCVLEIHFYAEKINAEMCIHIITVFKTI